MLVNDPVHQLEAREGDGEKDATVLVNVRGRHAEHLVQVLHVAVGVGGWRARVGVHRDPRSGGVLVAGSS